MKDQLKYWLPLIIMFIGFVVNGIGWLDSNNKRKADQEIFKFKIETIETRFEEKCNENKTSNEKQDEILSSINIAIGRITGILESD